MKKSIGKLIVFLMVLSNCIGQNREVESSNYILKGDWELYGDKDIRIIENYLEISFFQGNFNLSDSILRANATKFKIQERLKIIPLEPENIISFFDSSTPSFDNDVIQINVFFNNAKEERKPLSILRIDEYFDLNDSLNLNHVKLFLTNSIKLSGNLDTSVTLKIKQFNIEECTSENHPELFIKIQEVNKELSKLSYLTDISKLKNGTIYISNKDIFTYPAISLTSKKVVETKIRNLLSEYLLNEYELVFNTSFQ